MILKKMQLTDLHLAEKNVRKHTEKQIAEYVRSLEQFDQTKPIIIDDAGEIICGNGLYMALQRMGRTECYCRVMEGITPNQKKKLMLADNRIYELGVTDIDAFEEIIRTLGNDLDVPGWDDELLSALNATVPDVDEMVAGYGAFDSSYTERIRETQVQPVVPAAPVPQRGYTAPYGQLQPTSEPFPNDQHIPIAPSAQPMEMGNAGQVERYIICPKCGERICL